MEKDQETEKCEKNKVVLEVLMYMELSHAFIHSTAIEQIFTER